MNRKLCLCICMVTCLLVSCNNPKLQKASDNNHTNSIQKKQQNWEVTDISENKQVLKISHVMEMNQRVDMEYINYPAEYAQVSDGHYYYMTYGDKTYTIFMDHGKKVGNFCIKDGYVLEGCAKYKDKFYVTYSEENENFDEEGDSEDKEFGWVDFENRTVQHLYTEKMGDSSFFYTAICSDQFYLTDAYTQETLIKDFEGKYIKSIQTPEKGGNWWKASLYGVDGKNLYYHSINSDKDRNKVICVNQNTGKKETVFEYEIDKVSSEEVHGVSEMMKCGGTVFITETVGLDTHHRLYIIDSKKKEMQLVSSHIEDWTVSDDYIFYTDKKHRIHRWDKEDGKEKVISKIKAGNIKCTDTELYVREYDSNIIDNLNEDSADDYFTEIEGVKSNRFVMNFDGRNREKIAD